MSDQWFICGCLLLCVISMRVGENSVSPLCFPLLQGQPCSLMGPTDMRSAVMDTSRDFPSVCLSDGHPEDKSITSPLSPHSWPFLSQISSSVWMNASHLPLRATFLSAAPAFLSNKTSEQTAVSLKLSFQALCLKYVKTPATVWMSS